MVILMHSGAVGNYLCIREQPQNDIKFKRRGLSEFACCQLVCIGVICVLRNAGIGLCVAFICRQDLVGWISDGPPVSPVPPCAKVFSHPVHACKGLSS